MLEIFCAGLQSWALPTFDNLRGLRDSESGDSRKTASVCFSSAEKLWCRASLHAQ